MLKNLPRVTAESTAEPGAMTRRALRVEWIGQTVASILWIGSVLADGIRSPADWMQLAAASAWLVANVAALSTSEARP